MTTFYLIRHGVTEWLEQNRLHGIAESDLSERGRRMAELAGEAMRGVPLERIYCSPLRRCLQTAEPIARVSGVPITRCPGLIEMNFGWFEGKKSHWRHVRSIPAARFLYLRVRRLATRLSSEPRHRFESRVAKTWHDLQSEHTSGRVALVTHFQVIQQILTLSFGPGERKPPYTYSIPPACITEIQAENGKLTLVRLSDITHLAELDA